MRPLDPPPTTDPYRLPTRLVLKQRGFPRWDDDASGPDPPLDTTTCGNGGRRRNYAELARISRCTCEASSPKLGRVTASQRRAGTTNRHPFHLQARQPSKRGQIGAARVRPSYPSPLNKPMLALRRACGPWPNACGPCGSRPKISAAPLNRRTKHRKIAARVFTIE